jgi:hypothetical protein
LQKKYKHIIGLLLALLLVAACSLDDSPNSISGYTNDLCFQNALNAGVIFTTDGKVWLRAGEEEEEHFDISGWALRPCQLNLGYGREYYPALIEPAYVSAEEHAADYDEDERVIFLETENVPKVYPLELLNKHVIINDVVDASPVMISYSVFTDRPAVFQRSYCDTTFTFGVSGYTYWDYDIQNAINEFLLWDRETESLWWPLINKAVSGKMKGIWMVLYNESRWRETTWKDVIDNHPGALVLEDNQVMTPPVEWPSYLEVNCK